MTRLVTQRAAARELGLSPAFFRKWIQAGCPTVRRGGKELVDPDAARAWGELFAPDEDEAPARATRLHPADPRHAERAAAAALARINLAVEFGHAIRRDDATARYSAALFEFARLLNDAPHCVALDTWRADLEHALDAACEALTIDWPQTVPVAAPPAPDVAEGEAEFLPIPAADDPRAEFARVQAQRRASELATMRREVVSVADARRIVDVEFDRLRKRALRIPAEVARHVATHGLEQLEAWVEYCVEVAKADMRGDRNRPEPPRPVSTTVAQDFEDVDGLACAPSRRGRGRGRGRGGVDAEAVAPS